MTDAPGGHNLPSRYAVAGRLLVGGRLVVGTVVVDGERIAEVRPGPPPADLPTLGTVGSIVSPGLIDLQVNGAFGVEVGADPEALRGLAQRLAATGVTAFCPAVVSAPADHLRAVAAAVASARGSGGGARLLGLHLEGPLLAPSRAGAHAVEAIAMADATLDEVLDELLTANAVALMTLAPERPGALARIARLRAAGVTVSLGHTDATYDQMIAGIHAGATLVTHLYSAMSGLHHRAPGAVGAALTDDRVAVALIADGVHAHPAALSLALRAKGPDRIVLTTDAISAAGAPPGRYRLGGKDVISDGQSARLEDGTLAGSTLTMDRAVRAMARLLEARLEDALAMASTVPAALLGLPDVGRIAPGAAADLTLWSPTMDVAATIVAGQIAFRA